MHRDEGTLLWIPISHDTQAPDDRARLLQFQPFPKMSDSLTWHDVVHPTS